MAAVKAQKENGITTSVYARSMGEGYKFLLDDLKDFYSPIMSEQKYEFFPQIDGRPDGKGKMSWTNYLKENGRDAGTIRVKHIGMDRNSTSIDDFASSAKPTHNYWIFFNIIAGEAAQKRERDDFMRHMMSKYSGAR